eukprot:CAMPEP_0197524750 /NCGR_PEP_ID=MMETSP1318-20131121/9760_1 /TAXON_ID=552666 /ORGANISM="Partenskyella glossopodia, Strain RCC365" /LENGTH=212 /DNA_ID=CAMNT_0043077771 /DNA_START=39 /DNA_END=677 /DNA_ORIENTATION=-
MAPVAFLAGVWLAVCTLPALAGDVHATGNPHAEDTCPTEACKCPALSLNPLAALTSPLPTQSHTFHGIIHKKIMGFDVAIYSFKQPENLSHLQLPFKILPMHTIDLNGIVDVPVPQDQGADSWFPGYTWSILVCTTCEKMTHVGWRYESTSPENDHEQFYALIVDYSEDNSNAQATASAEAEDIGISIGMPAPSWMVAMAATIGADSGKNSL